MEKFTEFTSIHSLVSALPKASKVCESSNTKDKNWYGSASYDEAVERIVNGDTELAQTIRECGKIKLNIPCTGTRKKMVTRVAGFMPHVPNYLAGVPNNMIFCKEEKIAKKVIKVYYGCNTLGTESTKRIAEVSARFLSALMSLERQGYRIELYATNCATWCGDSLGFSVKLKDAGQHLDLVKCAFPLLSSSWNRRFGFRYRELNGWSMMGSSMDGDALRAYLKKNGVHYDVALSYYDLKDITSNEELEKLVLSSASN